MKLAHKIGLFFLLISSVSMVLALGYVYQVTQKSLTKAISVNLEALVHARTKHLETYLGMLRSSVVSLANSVLLPKALRTPPDDPGYKDALESADKLLKIKKLADDAAYEYMLLDASGKVLLATDETSVGQDKAADDYFLGARTNVHIKDIYFSPTKKQVLLAISVPIFDGKGGPFLGVFVARIKPDALYAILTGRTGLGETGQVYIVNKNNYMVTPCLFDEDAVLKEKVDTENVKSAREVARNKNAWHAHSGVHLFSDCKGEQVLGAHDYIEEMQWFVLAEISTKEAFVPLGRLRLVFMWVLLLSSFVSWVLGQMVARIIVYPIQQLNKGTEIVGNGNLDHKVAIPTRDEVGDLSRAFDIMTSNLKKTTASVEKFNMEIEERRKAEAALNESERRFYDVFYASKDAILLLSGNIFIDANNATARLLGYANRETFLKTHPSELSPSSQPDGRSSFEKADAMIRTAFEKGFHQFEWVHRKANGENILVQVSLTPVTIQGKQVLYCVWIDLTQKRQDERQLKEQSAKLDEALKESQKSHDILSSMLDDNNQMRLQFEKTAQQLDSILSSTQDVILMMDPKGKISFWNPAGERVLGYKSEEVLGKNLHQLLAPGRFHAAHGAAYPEFLRTGQGGAVGKTVELAAIRKDGVEIPISLSLSSVKREDGWHAVGIISDISERLKAQEELLKLTRAIEQSPVTVVITNLKGEIEYANPKFVKSTGYSLEEAIGQNPRVLKSGEMSPEQYKNLWEVITRGEEWRGEFHNKRKNGELYWESASISPIRDAKGNVSHYLAVKEDITEFKRVESEVGKMKLQLVQSDKLATLGEMATGMAHEMNQPLGGIALVVTSFKKYMEKKVLTEEKLLAGIKDIETSIGRMTQTINHIRVYARQETLEFEPLELPGTIDSALTLLGEQLRIHGIEVTRSVAPDLPQVKGEPHQLEQVWINLLSNARDAMDEKQKLIEEGKIAVSDYRKKLVITLSHQKDARTVVLTFSDNGMGMTEAQSKKVFDPFFTTKVVGKGTGLGLSISHGIIEKHHGTITIESAPGEGATFRITLPQEI